MTRRTGSVSLLLALAFVPWELAWAAATPSPSPSPRVSPSPKPASPKPKLQVTPSPKPSPTTRKRTFSNEDLPARPSPSPGTPTRQAPPADVEPLAESNDSGGKDYWRARFGGLRATIRGHETRLRQLEERIAALRNDRSQENVMDPNREQTRQAEIARLLSEVAAVETALTAARKELEDLDEEARRKAVPMSWREES